VVTGDFFAIIRRLASITSMKNLVLALLVILPMLASCQPEKPVMSDQPAQIPEIPAGAETATLGGGCYWCIEVAYRQLDGVLSVTSGFMGGTVTNPTYPQVCQGDTGHAEVVQVVFDPQKISYVKILDWFWNLHDPTTLNRQGNDVGTQYRSVIFYHSDAQRETAAASKATAAGNFKDPIVTAITQASGFYPAPGDHQNYYFQNKLKNPYCQVVIEPKLKKLKLDH
jgi:peptide-methionine (S)-S-oxide reductase